MEHKRLVNALQKAGLEVRRCTIDPINWVASGKNYRAEWWTYDGKKVSSAVYVIRHGDQNDYQSDYFPGFFERTIKGVVNKLLTW